MLVLALLIPAPAYIQSNASAGCSSGSPSKVLFQVILHLDRNVPHQHLFCAFEQSGIFADQSIKD